MKKLYKVHVSTYLVIEADEDTNPQDLKWISQKALSQHASDCEEEDFDYQEIKCSKDIPYPWDNSCLPYGGKDDKCIGEILKWK